MAWDPQRQQALRMEGIIIIVIIVIVVVVVVVVKVTIRKNKNGLVTPASGSPEVNQGLTKRSLNMIENKM
jgi:septation ring formation regulator EzrA